MIISDEQAREAARILKHTDSAASCHLVPDVSPELFEQARRCAEQAPEMRADRVSEARAHIANGTVSSREVANKMVARIISDALR